MARDVERCFVGELGDGCRHLGRVLRPHHASLRCQHAEEPSPQSERNAHQHGKLRKSFLSFYSFGFNLSITEVQNICRPMLKILLKV